MALQSSGTISLSEIETEFGGSAPTSLSEYYAAAAGIPGNNNPLSLSDFYGAEAFTGYPFATYGSSLVGTAPGWFANGYGWGNVTSSNGTSPIPITNSSASLVGIVGISGLIITIWGIGSFSSYSSLTITSTGITAGSKTGFSSQSMPAQSLGGPSWSATVFAANTWSSGNSYDLTASI